MKRNHRRKSGKTTTPTPGYVYLALVPSSPGLVKIGRTERTPEERLQELYTTGVPFKLELAHALYVSDMVAVENALHKRFAHARENPNREFFRVKLQLAIDALNAFREPTLEHSAALMDELHIGVPASVIPVAVVENGVCDFESEGHSRWFLYEEPTEPSERALFVDRVGQLVAAARNHVKSCASVMALRLNAWRNAKNVADTTFLIGTKRARRAEENAWSELEKAQTLLVSAVERCCQIDERLATSPEKLLTFLSGYWYYRSRVYKVDAPLLTWNERRELVKRVAARLGLDRSRQHVCPPEFVRCTPPDTWIFAIPTDSYGAWVVRDRSREAVLMHGCLQLTDKGVVEWKGVTDTSINIAKIEYDLRNSIVITNLYRMPIIMGKSALIQGDKIELPTEVSFHAADKFIRFFDFSQH